ncbi:MAG: hypothetical protein D6706_12945, partial [Chloroflexi bacterium]
MTRIYPSQLFSSWMRISLLALFFLCLNGTTYAWAPPDMGPSATTPPAYSGSASLVAQLTMTPAQIAAGETTSLQINITNSSPQTVSAITLQLFLPEGISLGRRPAPTWTIPALPAGQTRTATYKLHTTTDLAPGDYTLRLEGKNKDGETILLAWGTLWLQREDNNQPVMTQLATAAAEQPEEPRGWVFRPIEPVPALFAGTATYSYPLETPPARNNLGPQLSLTYNSRTVDGQIGWFDSNQYGAGWSLTGIPVIVRENIHYCWGGNYEWLCGGDPDSTVMANKFTLYLNGANYELKNPVSCGSNCVRYEAKNGPHLRVEQYTAGGANVSGQYWLVRQTDGRVYRFGYYEDSEQILFRTNSTNNPQDSTLPYTGKVDKTAVYRWFLDQVTDGHTNQMVILYAASRAAGVSGCTGYIPAGLSAPVCREVDIWPQRIRYNNNMASPDRNNANHWQAEVVFEWTPRNSDVYDQADGKAPIFRTRVSLSAVQTRIRNGAGQWENKWRYNLTQREVPCPGGSGVYCPNNSVRRVLDRIQRVESNGSTWPAVTFAYTDLTSGVGTYNGENVYYTYPYLNRVNNGYGGVYEFSYGDTGGQANGARNWRVNQLRIWDGVTHIYGQTNPAQEQIFEYVNPCYDKVGQCYSGSGNGSFKLVGHQIVAVNTYEYVNGARQFLSRTEYEYYVPGNGGGAPLLYGRQKRETTYWENDNDKQRRQEKTFFWALGGSNCPTTNFNTGWVCLYEERQTTYGWQATDELTAVSRYRYDPAYQGNRQWGFRTHTELVLSAETQRTTIVGYATNSGTAWRAAPWFEGVWANENNEVKIKKLTLYLYGTNLEPDNQTLGRSDQLTWERAIIAADCANGRFQTADTRYGYGAYGLLTQVWTLPEMGNQAGQCGQMSVNWSPANDLNRAWGNPTELHYTGDGLLIDWVENELNQRTTYVYGGPNAIYPWLITA